jgi:hypothetical protein
MIYTYIYIYIKSIFEDFITFITKLFMNRSTKSRWLTSIPINELVFVRINKKVNLRKDLKSLGQTASQTRTTWITAKYPKPLTPHVLIWFFSYNEFSWSFLIIIWHWTLNLIRFNILISELLIFLLYEFISPNHLHWYRIIDIKF